jgi:predicted ATP-grasp superfamily ATP-dependent carboligase
MLGVIRGIGMAGYKVEVIKLIDGAPKLRTPELCSKYVKKFEYTSINNSEEFIALLESKASHITHKLLIIPTDDYSTSLLDRNTSRLSAYYWIPNIAEIPGKLSLTMDKYVQKKIALENGFCVASSVTITIDNNGNYEIPENIIFPCCTKPQVSIGSPKEYILKCENASELKIFLDDISGNGKNTILVEEYLEIEEEYVVPGVSCNGITLAPSIIRKLKVGSGAHKGVTAMGVLENFADIPEVQMKLIKMISSLKLTGLFDVELIKSNGKFYFNELNLRYGAAGYVLTACGINLPRILPDFIMKGIKPQQMVGLKTGVSFVSEKVVFDGYCDGYLSWKEYCRDIHSAQIHFIKSAHDIGPYLSYLIFVVKSQIKRFSRRASNKKVS